MRRRQRRSTRAAIVGLLMAAAAGDPPAAAQDAAAGRRVFNQCATCHPINQGGSSRVGPNLHGVVGRRAASVAGFRYSGPMQRKGEEGWVWTEENLHPYLRKPREAVPGTTMAFPGLRGERQVNDLIAYLKQQSGAAQ